MEWLSKISDLVKLPTKYYAILAMTTGAVLFLPTTLLKRLNLDAIPAPYGTVIGIVFIVTSVFVLVNSASWCVAWYRWRVRAGERIRRVQDKMLSLDGAERSVLREFFVYGQTTIRLPLVNPVVAGLVAEGVLRQVGQFGRVSLHGPLFSFRLSDEASIIMDVDVLGFPDGAFEVGHSGRSILTDQGEHWLIENRPSFAYDVAHVDRGIRRW